MITRLKLHLTILLIVLSGSWTLIHAQDSLQVTVPSTLAGQYNDLIQKSRINEQGFKIINPARLNAFQKNYMDSLQFHQRMLAEAQNKIVAQNKLIRTLKDDLSAKEESLTKSQNVIDEINVLGIPFQKSTYNWTMWGLVIGLSLILAFSLIQAISARKEASYRIKLFSELSEEFHVFKAKAHEKEIKLARELQTEKNRVDELLGR
ncbi:MAG TPA: hypothetical protein VEV16_00490 [Daejeonella sp.]|nr:hypothetical protein [Daejeonella sp.]